MTVAANRREFAEEVRRLVAELTPPSAKFAYRRILLGYNGSTAARAALERVAALAGPETEVTVITVIPFESIEASPDPIKTEQRDWQWRLLTEAAALLGRHGVHAFIEASAGNPAPVILEVAEALDADLIVLGRDRDHRWRPTMSRKSVRRAVARGAGCDLLVTEAPPG